MAFEGSQLAAKVLLLHEARFHNLIEHRQRSGCLLASILEQEGIAELDSSRQATLDTTMEGGRGVEGRVSFCGWPSVNRPIASAWDSCKGTHASEVPIRARKSYFLTAQDYEQ